MLQCPRESKYIKRNISIFKGSEINSNKNVLKMVTFDARLDCISLVTNDSNIQFVVGVIF